jgi:integrase
LICVLFGCGPACAGRAKAEPGAAPGRGGAQRSRLDDARHTAATLLIEQGVHIRVVQEVLGHTRVTTTERYTHVATLQMRDASERMNEALWGQG